MKQAEVLATLETVASDQWGIVTTAQAGREGVERLQLSEAGARGGGTGITAVAFRLALPKCS